MEKPIMKQTLLVYSGKAAKPKAKGCVQKRRLKNLTSVASLTLCSYQGFSCWLVLTTLVLLTPCIQAQGFFTPPPKVNNTHIVSNGIVYYIKGIPPHCDEPLVTRYPSGGIVQGKRALLKTDSPHVIYGNIEIPPSSCLWIEPGSLLKFGPGFGIIVNGTLIARGSEEDGGRITMTKDQGQDTGAPTGDWKYDARLSDGNTTRDGRLDLLYEGKWRAICTNYHNFTMIDINVTCRHLGFLKGNFTYHSFSRNLTRYMLWEKPGCTGNENSLLDCPGASRIRVGTHICDGQQVVGFECEGLRPGLATDHWRGIEFFNSTSHLVKSTQDNDIYNQESWSWLEYLDIYYPGLDTFHGRTSETGIFYPKAAISASPLVPLMNNVTIMYGAYDAFNLTEVTGPIHIANCTIQKNRGNGIFIKSAVGMTLINMTQVSENWGDGIKFYISNLTIHDFRRNFTFDSNFCFRSDNPSQIYPVFEHLDAVAFDGNMIKGSRCTRSFSARNTKNVNLHFLLMERDPEATGSLTVREGHAAGTLIGVFEVANGSFPQSVRTQLSTMWIQLDFSLPQGGCKTFAPCLRFLLRLSAYNGTEDEFHLVYSNIKDNIGYGVNIQDMRSKVLINTTEVSRNQFGAGIRVYQGAGEVIINKTVLKDNMDAGINITYSGGYQLINRTSLIGNKGYGLITEYLRLNRSRIEFMQKLEVVGATFEFNELIGLRVGNYCRGGNILVNESNFFYNYDEAIEYLSCNISTGKYPPTNFSLAFNVFKGNIRHALLAKPMLNTVGIITNCSFINHTLGALRIDNGYDLLISKWYREFPVNYNIFENIFKQNRGRYAVYLRLTDNSPLHKLYFKFNSLTDNNIQESFIYTNPRNRANAVAVVSSGNIEFKRNILANREHSVRELATHLLDPSVRIDAKENYWDIEIIQSSQFEQVHMNIFDQDDRYNLAHIDYYPALKTSRFYENQLTTDVPEYRWNFERGNNVIGGLLDYRGFTGQRGQTYYVDRDIYVYPGQIVTLEPQVTLEFAPSVGIVVHGCLRADGQNSEGTIQFRVWTDSDLLPLENRTASVRLANGTDLYEGRLEVLIDGEWGTVCNEGWTDQEAALVCQQLGLVYNPDYGKLTDEVKEAPPPDMRVLMSWVSCDEVDDDLTKCRAERAPDISCGHDQDIHLRCHEPTWAGLTLPATPRLAQSCETQLRALHLERAGLLDAETMSFTPALSIDYNYYQITDVTVTDSLSDGVHISYIYPYDTARLEYMKIHNNLGNGVVSRFPRLDLIHSNISENGKAGFLYDPFFSEYQALSVRSMIHETRRSLITDTPALSLDNGRMAFLLCPSGFDNQENHIYNTEVSAVSSTYRIVVQILDFYPVKEIEEVVVFDSPRANINDNTKRWRVPEDLVDFPLMSTFQTITIRLTVRGLRSGRLAFALISQEARAGAPVLTTRVYNTTFQHNYQGIQSKHYNNPSNKRLEIFHRFHLETIVLERATISNSRRETIYMPSVTKFNDDYIPTYEDMTTPERVAVIRYNITLGEFLDNEVGILGEHNHVDFANNVWQWSLSHSKMLRTRNGGVQIEVPRVNEESERMKHSVSIIETTFIDNTQFGCAVKGYYADVKIENNLFDNNRCLLGLFAISGMEKTLNFIGNRIHNNVGRYMLDIDILSHSEYSEPVTGVMRKNNIQNNRYEGLDLPGFENSPKTFAVSFRGVQNMTANRNLFGNPELGFELVAGITALSLENPVDVKENYWGRTDYAGILDRIFDFDDWNNYAIADFFPYLTKADFDSDVSGGQPVKPPLDSSRLGGRVLENQILAYKPTPYIVERDLTIMPEATFTISAGTELQFRPNIGILVLGRLVARGVKFNRIRMRPVQSDTSSMTGERRKRAVTSTIRLRSNGTLMDAGFLELFNSSTKTWNIMCDSQFNEKSAEVVCRQLGKETINVRVRFTHLYDFYIYGEPQYFIKEFWYESYYCRGDETDLSYCTKRYNYNMQDCIRAANYTFIVCGERNLDPRLQYWGNVRFASRSYEEQPLEDDIGRQESILEYVDIEGAGMLHGEKVGAIQTTYVTPKFSDLNITQCAENGFDVIAPRRILEMERLNVSNNLGFGLNFLILNGESNDGQSSFLQLGASTIPYHVYGLVEICRMEKRIVLNTRMILYYKYGPNMRDCVKIIRSGNPRSKIGLRFLQLNLFHEYFSRNVIEIFDGDSITLDKMIAEIMANTSNANIEHLYSSSGDTLVVHLHASVSHGSYGFIAEVVQVPLTGLTYPDSNYKHTIFHSISSKNQDGAIQYKNVGEVNPSLFIDRCWLEDNGVAILNLTSPPTIDISLQGTRLFRFASNFVSRNKGGTYLSLYTKSTATALSGNMTNNIFSFGTNGEALNITGHYFQRLYMFQNYIFNFTTGDWRDVIHIRGVVVNYTYNYLDNNTGHYILATYDSGSQNVQQFTRSGFVRNNATSLIESTIKIGEGRPFFENNYIVNDDNDFEMETYPKLGVNDGAINAKNNWWGSDARSYINGKIWDELDKPHLVSVDFWQPKLDNRSVVEGKCLPGWKLDSGRCYRFMGGALPYYQAYDFCRQIGAFLAEARDREGFINYLLRLMRNANDGKDRVWVMSEVGSRRCSALEHSYIVYEEDCWNLLYPFICEKDPYLLPPAGLESTVRAMAIGIGAGIGGVLILVAIIFGILWCVKSKRREKERFERTASLRSSVRSSMRMSKSTLTALSEGYSRRRLNEIDGYSQASSEGTKISHGMPYLNGSMSSLDQDYKHAKTVPIGQRDIGRNRWQEQEDRAPERQRTARAGRQYQEDEGQTRYAESEEKEESETDVEKKELQDSEDEDSSFDSTEGDEEEETAARIGSESNVYRNIDPLQAQASELENVRRTQSRDDIYKIATQDNNPIKSKSLSSFGQPDSQDESPVANIFLPRRNNLHTPPPTPQSYTSSSVDEHCNPTRDFLKPHVAPKPVAHPALRQLQQSPVPSDRSQSSGNRPLPLPRRNIEGSRGSSPRETPLPFGGRNYPEYENQAAPVSLKQPMGSQEFSPASSIPSLRDKQTYDYDYKPQTPLMSPSHHLPHLPRYSPPLPMERPPSYDEQDHPYYLRQDPGYLSNSSASYIPSQEPPQPDVLYLPHQKPDARQFLSRRDQLGGSRENLGDNSVRLGGNTEYFRGSRENLGRSREHLSGSREHLGRSREHLSGSHEQLSGSRGHLAGSRDQLNYPYSPAASSPVLYLNKSNSSADKDHLETEI